MIYLLKRYTPKFGSDVQQIKERYEQEARLSRLSQQRKEKTARRLAEVLDHSIEE
jgi:hypothetical protein